MSDSAAFPLSPVNGNDAVDAKETDLRQRLPLSRIKRWQEDGMGLFLHYGMSTYDGEEFSSGDAPAASFSPSRLDVRQWVSTAVEMGAAYAILTAKHVAGFCLWPTLHSDYHVGNSPCGIDIVEEFVRECRAQGIQPGLYYCSWDNHHLFGSKTPLHTSYELSYTTEEYRAFQTAQISELLDRYGPLHTLWIDIPRFLPRDYRDSLYKLAADRSPDTVITTNSGCFHHGVYPVAEAWPSDVFVFERLMPGGLGGYNPVQRIEGLDYYLPAEICDTMGKQWFYKEDDEPRGIAYLMGSYLYARGTDSNFLLNIGPGPDGRISEPFRRTARELGRRIKDLSMDLHCGPGLAGLNRELPL